MKSDHIPFLNLFKGPVQYVVPRWQRRYCWGEDEIVRLVDDLLTVANARDGKSHYGGTLLMFQERGAPGIVNTTRVVDGQQRLTTVSILLACIAAKLGPQGRCGVWTAELLRNHLLVNRDVPAAKRRKLRLQDRDDGEYCDGFEGRPVGAGSVAHAWKLAHRLVDRYNEEDLIKGLERLYVVSIGLDDNDDPQQIFESLNATGRPLTESEKVKNWLLMGLPDAKQQELHDNHWLEIEQRLGALHTTKPIDTLLRDFLRWKTGDLQGIDQAYDEFRRWAVRQGRDGDCEGLFRDLARLAGLYGILTGTAGAHPDKEVELMLRHLRAMGIDVHRPLTLRLLDDAERSEKSDANGSLANTLAAIGSWITRLWFADRPMAGMNKALAELAHGPGPGDGEDFAGYWIGRIRKLRNTRVGVPDDEAVRDGVRTQKAYGGSATRSSFAVLCTLMESEQGDQAPDRCRLTIEHVMPRNLTEDWKRSLGSEAEDTHGIWKDRFANLTLSGDSTNSRMSDGTFDEKRTYYAESSIGMTRRLAREDKWTVEELELRANDLAERILKRWPWQEIGMDASREQRSSPKLKWRLEDGPWRPEPSAAQMVLNVAAALLTRDPANAEKLSGEEISSNIHAATTYPPGTMARSLLMRAIPGHHQFVLYPYGQDYPTSVRRCQAMGERCGVTVQVDYEDASQVQSFWRFLKTQTGGLPGQTDAWRGPNQWIRPLETLNAWIGISVMDSKIRLYILANDSRPFNVRAAQLRRYSWAIRDQMADQDLGNEDVAKGWSATVNMNWERGDEANWPEAAQWIMDQFERLQLILSDPVEGEPIE